MTIYPIYTFTFFYILIFFMVRQQFNVRSEETHSLFSFSFTNATSPYHIEDTCLVIDNITLFSMYFGVQLFIRQTTENVSCKPENIELKEIRKDIFHAEKARLLCRTTLTVSISSTQCEKSIVDLKRVCEEQNPIKTSIYFQECEDVDYHDKKAFTNGTMTITMSAFSTPTNSRFGPVYEIPRVQCSRKTRMSTKRTANHSRVIPLGNGKVLHRDHTKQGYTVFAVFGSGLAGLLGGVMITLLTCIRVQKWKDRRTRKKEIDYSMSVKRWCMITLQSSNARRIFETAQVVKGILVTVSKCTTLCPKILKSGPKSQRNSTASLNDTTE